jgi:hypothetical protein
MHFWVLADIKQFEELKKNGYRFIAIVPIHERKEKMTKNNMFLYVS